MLPGNRPTTLSSNLTTFRLGDLLVDPARCVVQGPFGEHHLEPKVMAVLSYLARRPGKVVSRNELLDSVWAGVVVGDQVLTRCVSELRKQLGDRTGSPQHIQTISKKGYRLIHEPEWSASVTDDINRQLQASGSAPLNTLAVMPLEMLAAHPSERFLGVGFARDLNHLLSLVPGLKVVASSSVEHRVEQLKDPIKIGQSLSARYIVCGTIEHRGAIFRLRLELMDTATNEQLWADRYDREIGDFFSVQDELVQQIARSLSTALELGQVQEIQSRGLFNLSVYERIHLAEDARRNYSREAADFVIENLQAALSLQPDNGVVHALLAMQYSQNLVSRWTDDAAQDQRLAVDHLRQAVRLAPNDARVLMAAGIAALMRGQHQEALVQLERSLAKNPNEPHVLAEYGTARFYVTRELAPSITLMEQAEKAAPQHPRYSIWAYRRGICYYEAGVFELAIKAYDESIARTPNYHHTYLTKALALVSMEDEAAARAAIQQGIEHAPGLLCEGYLSGVRSFGLTMNEAQMATFRQLFSMAGGTA